MENASQINNGNNCFYNPSTSSSSNNYLWVNNRPKSNELFYPNPNYSESTYASVDQQKSAIIRQDQMLYKSVDEDFDVGITAPIPLSNQTSNIPSNDYGYADETEEDPFVNALVMRNDTGSCNYNRYNLDGYTNGDVNMLNVLNVAAALQNADYQNNFVKEEYPENYNEQNDVKMEDIQMEAEQSTESINQNTSEKIPKRKGRPPKIRDPSEVVIKNTNGKKGRPKIIRPEGELPVKRKRPVPEKSPMNGRSKRLPTENGETPSNNNKRAIPRMRKNVHMMKMNPEQIDDLKKTQKPFLQSGVCYQIAPNLDQCLECVSSRKPYLRAKRESKEVDCRFFEFRKLIYTTEGELTVKGFLDTVEDPLEVDISIWLPSEKYNLRNRTLTINQSRLILTHIGDSFCEIIKKEQFYYKTYKKDDKLIIWKRLIRGVREICDLCSTTLFNYHFICNKCGFSCCIDCYEEHKHDDINFEFHCTCKKAKIHEHNDLQFTQMFTGDSLNEMQKIFHEICEIWKIEHKCELMENIKLENLDLTIWNFARNTIEENTTGQTVMSKEHTDPTDPTIEIDKDFWKNINLVEEDDDKSVLDEIEICEEHIKSVNEKQRQRQHQSDYQKSLKYLSNGMEFVKNPSRIMCATTSSIMYPDVPHKWLCCGKILRLMDPIHPKNDEIFHDQWQRGQPIIVSNILTRLKQDLWVPQAFSAEFGKQRSDLINCMNGNLVQDQPMSVFWDGFETLSKRLRDQSGLQMLLKLKDWPPDEDFAKTMPDRFEDIMNGFPMSSYTSRNGEMNLVRYLPYTFVTPDLGPKMYNAYGSPFYLSKGTTNLHLDVSDAVNVMCYVGIPTDEADLDSYLQEAYKAIVEADCDVTNRKRMLEDGDIPGALWHIYEANDSDKIRDLLVKVAEEEGHVIENHHDPIHDQNWYLDGPLRKRLFGEYGVKGYAFVQFMGDCVFIPAGTPHQVRNIFSCIKVAEDFVSPENISHCLHLSREFRKLTKTHTNNEDKLQIKSIVYHSVKEIISYLNYMTSKRFYNTSGEHILPTREINIKKEVLKTDDMMY